MSSVSSCDSSVLTWKPSMAADDGALAREHDVRRAADAVGQRVLAAVQVVDLGLGVVRRRRVGQRAVLGVGVLGLPALVHEQRHVAAVVDDEVRAVALGVGVRPGDGVHRALPVLLERLALPGEDGRGPVARDGGRGVVLRREDVARAPADVAAELLERLDEHGRLDRHVERARDARALERLRGAVL